MILAAWLMYHAVRVVAYWPRASATIVRYSIRRYEGQPFYHPVVKFTTRDDKPVVAIWNHGYWRRYWPTQTAMPVHYSPQNPQRIEIVLPWNLWGFALPLIIIALLVFIALIGYVLPKYHGSATMFDIP